jgi:hypothetical protein
MTVWKGSAYVVVVLLVVCIVDDELMLEAEVAEDVIGVDEELEMVEDELTKDELAGEDVDVVDVLLERMLEEELEEAVLEEVDELTEAEEVLEYVEVERVLDDNLEEEELEKVLERGRLEDDEDDELEDVLELEDGMLDVDELVPEKIMDDPASMVEEVVGELIDSVVKEEEEEKSEVETDQLVVKLEAVEVEKDREVTCATLEGRKLVTLTFCVVFVFVAFVVVGFGTLVVDDFTIFVFVAEAPADFVLDVFVFFEALALLFELLLLDEVLMS